MASDKMFWMLTIISLCGLLLFFLIWKETQRPNRSGLAARLVASVLAVSSLACMALPIALNRKVAVTDATVAIILTEGYNKDSVQQFINAHVNPKIFTVHKSINAFGAKYVDMGTLSEDSIQPDALHIFGFGLDEYDLRLIANASVSFHPGSIDNRITSVSWTRNLTSGESFIVQGNFRNAKKAVARIILNGFDTNLDSVTVEADKETSFQLSTIPKHVDKAVYFITVISGGDTLESNLLPVDVSMPAPLRILVLASSPDFENKFLKNWLTQNDYSFALRTTISQSKYDKQYINTAQVGLDRITSALLDKFDMVIADIAELKNLPSADQAILRSYVDNKGLGLLVKVSGAEKSSAFYTFPLTESRDSVRQSLKLRIGITDMITPIKVEQPVFIQQLPGTQPLIKDQQMRIVASSKMSGSGKVVLATIPNTYSWWLAGNTKDYTSYWAFLLKTVAKKVQRPTIWKTNSELPQENKEVHLTLQTANPDAPKMQTGPDLIYPEQNYLLPYEWKARYWPLKTGWQTLMYQDSIISSWFIHESRDWQGIQAAEKTAWTKKYLRNKVAASQNFQSDSLSLPVPKMYFFILFILFSGFLWFEKKYRSGDVN